MKKKVLLVEPDFPYASKSKNRANEIHKNFVPIGLLKLGAFYKSRGYDVKLVRGKNLSKPSRRYYPDLILVTSLFTYWSKYVWDSIAYYRALFPKAKIQVGGIYSTLHSGKEEFEKKIIQFGVKCIPGLHQKAEELLPDYSLLEKPLDYHVTHGMRGCIRRCSFCGTWKLEPRRTDKQPDKLIEELKSIGKNKVIFFDNNFLANQQIKKMLVELSALRINGRPVVYESQSGFDGRLIERDSELAVLLRKARFRDIRFAWDNAVNENKSIERQLQHLIDAGYKTKDISVFVIYNYNVSYEDMLKKLEYCKKWGVQIADCRYRPLESTDDNYNPYKSKEGQNSSEYYIHVAGGWDDWKVRDFRRRVREHNIWVRYGRARKANYSKAMEKWSRIHRVFKFFGLGRPPMMGEINKSETLKTRVQMMSKVFNYSKRNGKVQYDFSKLNKAEIDAQLLRITRTIEKEKQLTTKS